MTAEKTTALTEQPAWRALAAHARSLSGASLPQLFAQDAERFSAFSFRLPGLLADFSKTLATQETLRLLLNLARETGVEARRNAMFAGEKINVSENRAVLHTALRAPEGTKIFSGGADVVPEARATLDRMADFADAVRRGKHRGHTGEEITDVVNIGIGGSSLGPQMAAEALAGYRHMRITPHFVSNVEASELHRALQNLAPERTLFLIASKTFTTQETLMNARIARDKLVKHFGGDETAVGKHFAALSANADAAAAFGIAPENVFPFRDWVGGRYSTWSSIGLSVMLAVGPEHFREFLAGAGAMDAHFRDAPPERNIPLVMGLLGVWHRNFLGYPAYACIPYHSGLRRFPAWLQQCDMESNGKSADLCGTPVAQATGPLVFGEPGTDAQHSFFQWLHQGTDVVPVEFIAAVKTPFGGKGQQNMLLANCLAQGEALMAGKPEAHFPGNRPSATLLLDELSPRGLGMLMALYEHRVFVQGAVWNVNSFDQPGVELGKVLARTIGAELDAGTPGLHDGSTAGLMRHILEMQA